MAKKKQTKKVSNQVEKKSQNFGNYFNNNNIIKKVLPIFLILIVMIVAFYVRSGPVTLSSMDARVESSVYSNIQYLISQQVNQEYPLLNDYDKQTEVQKRYNEVLDTGVYQGYVISDLVEKNVNSVKAAFQADNGQTYLNAIDPYHFLKYTDLYDENGYVGTNLDEQGNPVLNYKLAPVGTSGSLRPTFHNAVELFAYKLTGTTYQSTDGEKTAAIFLIPVIFAMLAVIPIFLILRKYTNDLTAFFGSSFLMVISTYVSRTIAGFVDTDAYNVFFPLLVVLFVVLAILENKKYLKYVYAGIAGFFQGMFLWAWGNGWFIFLFLCVALIGYIGYLFIVDIIRLKKFTSKVFTFVKDEFIILISYVISSTIFTYVFAKNNIFSQVFSGFTGSLDRIASISTTNIWPNVFSSVAELNPASFTQILSTVGGKFVFLLAILGLVFLTVDYSKKYDWARISNRILLLASVVWVILLMNVSSLVALTANHSFLFICLLFIPVGVGVILSLINENKSPRVFLAIILSIWIAGTIYMSLNGVRFILLLAPAFAIAFAIALYEVAKIINNFIKTEVKPKSLIGKNIFGIVVVLAIFGYVFVPMFNSAVYIGDNTYPNFDDNWYNSMYKIKNESQSDAIITSWWDFGHFFAAISDRGVTFDGGSQTTPRAHWVGKLLMENDEEVSHDILKMLVCGGNEAFNTFYSYVGKDSSDSVKINKILYSSFGVQDKRSILENNKYYDLSDEQVNNILEKLDCAEPVEDFLITSEDMVNKAGVWAHWGSWNFTKKYIYDNYNQLSVQEIADNIDENVTIVSDLVQELQNIDTTVKEQGVKRENLVNQWLADYPSYVPIQNNYEYPCSTYQNTSLMCQNSVQIDINTGKVLSHQFGDTFTFRNIYLPGYNNSLSVVEQNSNGIYDGILVPTSSGVSMVITNAPLGGSLFTKLFYLDGAGTKYFDKFDEFNSATGANVKIWKANWNLDNSSISY